MYHAGLLILRTKDNIVTVNNNSPFQDYVHPDDQTQPTFKMMLSLVNVPDHGCSIWSPQTFEQGTLSKCHEEKH